MHHPLRCDITGEVGGVAVTGIEPQPECSTPCGRDITGEVGRVAVTGNEPAARVQYPLRS